MADRTITERLQPSLLDRLTDDDPESKVERREHRVIDVRRLRDIIQRDLAWLLNTTNMESQIEGDELPHVISSTLNFGIREVAGEITTAERADQIREAIRVAIERFETRIAPGSVYVEFRSDMTKSDTLIAFDIRADMWAQPVPLELYMRSEVNIVTGELKLERRA